MTDPIRPKSPDAALDAALDSAGQGMEERLADLDLVSSTIRWIEEYFTTAGIKVPAKVRVWSSGFQVSRERSGEVYQDEDFVEWCPAGEASGRWRVMYRQVRRYRHAELTDRAGSQGPSPDERSEDIAFSPLIETSVALRLRMYRGLADLIHTISRQIEARPNERSEGSE